MNSAPKLVDDLYVWDDEEEFRLSSSGFSIKTGWGENKRVVASYPGKLDPLDEDQFQQWLADAEAICDAYNLELLRRKKNDN